MTSIAMNTCHYRGADKARATGKKATTWLRSALGRATWAEDPADITHVRRCLATAKIEEVIDGLDPAYKPTPEQIELLCQKLRQL